jgi:hypothetical protein
MSAVKQFGQLTRPCSTRRRPECRPRWRRRPRRRSETSSSWPSSCRSSCCRRRLRWRRTSTGPSRAPSWRPSRTRGSSPRRTWRCGSRRRWRRWSRRWGRCGRRGSRTRTRGRAKPTPRVGDKTNKTNLLGIGPSLARARKSAGFLPFYQARKARSPHFQAREPRKCQNIVHFL